MYSNTDSLFNLFSSKVNQIASKVQTQSGKFQNFISVILPTVERNPVSQYTHSKCYNIK